MAEALEKLYGEDAEEVSPQLAWHYDQAGEADKAIEYLIRAGDRAAAQSHYSTAQGLFARIGTKPDGMESTAGLARSLAALGEKDRAYELAKTVWSYMCEHGSAGMEFPMRVYGIVADFFDAAGQHEDSKAAVEAGYRDLMARAERITNPEWRKSYLENVAERWKALHSGEQRTPGLVQD